MDPDQHADQHVGKLRTIAFKWLSFQVGERHVWDTYNLKVRTRHLPIEWGGAEWRCLNLM